MRFEGKVAIVTGAGSGIGQAVAVAAAEAGAGVVITDIDARGLAKTNEQIREKGANSVVIEADIRKPDNARDICQTTVEEMGGIDLLCYSAGIQTYGTVVDTDEELWDRTLNVNLKGMYLVAKHAIPSMIKRGGGSIVNVASVQGIACQQNVAAYATSKGGAIALSRAMAMDHARENIRVNCLCPGSIDTPMLRFGAGEHGDPDEVIKAWGENHPLGRVGTPEEMARTVMFLWSSDAGFITAQPIIADGGLISGIF